MLLGDTVAKLCKKFDFVHQSVSPRESVGSGNETNLCYCEVGSMRVPAIAKCFVSAFCVLFADG